MKQRKLLVVCAMLFTILVSLCPLSANAEELQDKKILEAEILGAKKLAPLVPLKNAIEQVVVAWLWEEPVVYSPTAKVENLAPKKLLVPENTLIPNDVMREGQWLWESANKAVKEQGKSSLVLMQREAWRTYYKGDFQKALTIYEKINQTSPNFWTSIRLGELWSSKDAKKSSEYYQKAYAVVEGTKSQDFILKVANAAYLAEDYQKAAELYTLLIKEDSTKDNYFLYRGNAYFLQNNLDAAALDYTKGIQLNPGRTDFYLNRARVYSEKKEVSLAIGDYQKYLEIAPQDNAVWTELIEFLNTNNRKASVRPVVEKWTIVQPKEAAAWNAKGTLDFEEKKYDAALISFDKATTLDEKLASAWYNKALCYENIGIPKDWTTEKKWEQINKIKYCYEQFLKYSDPKHPKRERAQRRIKEMSPDTKGAGKLLDI